MSRLKRELGLGYATLFGVGLILGAGIYVLIGRAAGIVGDAVWASVAFSGVIAVATAFSYAELSSIFAKAASTYTYVREAFPGAGLLAFFAAWMLFFGGVAGAATAALGFAGYFSRLAGLGEGWVVPVTVALLAVLSVLNWWGIKESAFLSAVFTVIEAGGLVLVVLLGFLFPARSPGYLSFNPSVDPVMAVLVGAAVFYFAYTGFEYQPTLSEETVDPERVIPKSIVLAVSVTTLLYLLVSLSVVRLMSWEELGASKAPMADAASRAWPPAFHLLMFIALFATTNTSLGFLVSASRLAYGLAEEGVAWSGFGRVDGWRRTPHVAVAFTGVLAALLVFATDYLPSVTGWRLSFGGQEYQLIDLVGKTASLAVLLAFFVVNAAVVALRRREGLSRRFRVPLNVGDFPVLPVLADILIAVFVALSFWDWIVWLSTALVAALGLLLYKR
ncbi:APC family permease [Thermofilum pendens]|uniref:Amino acid permease-associated region n=1 Tax=Thermofilum pendens (strain DSM 2475 / Hrk 5) TaxID=368408 RepID=A1RW83_THEPD|nr:APC family permease [Thermofilum pendens]ABL77463.1 amino acid permease-associated region [Thermofilum pendens Hrk 5]